MMASAHEHTGDIADQLEELDKRFRRPLLSYFSKRVRDYSDAEDLTQEVFLRLARTQQKFLTETADGYVFTIAVNVLRDRTRRAAARLTANHQSLEPDDSKIEGQLREEIGPERVLLGRESLNVVLTALAELDEKTVDIFLLFRVEGLRQREIAELYAMTVGAVEKRIARATVHLAARFRSKRVNFERI